MDNPNGRMSNPYPCIMDLGKYISMKNTYVMKIEGKVNLFLISTHMMKNGYGIRRIQT